jgi:AP-3 complex subunit delta
VRVEDVRGAAMSKLLPMLADETLFANARLAVAGSAAEANAEAAAASAAAAVEGSAVSTLSGASLGAGQVLYAAAWIVGEFCAIIPASMHAAVIDALLHPSVQLLPPAVQAVYVQSTLKLLAAAAGAAAADGSGATFLKVAASVLERLNAFAHSAHVEVQERAVLAQQLLATLGVPFTAPPTPASEAAAKAKAEADLLALAGEAGGAAPATPAALPPLEPDVKFIASILASLFTEPLKPVAAKAQKRVVVPDGLDLDKWINPAEESAAEEDKRAGVLYSAISFEDS